MKHAFTIRPLSALQPLSRSLLLTVLLFMLPAAHAVVQVFAQPPSAAGGSHKSAWYPPDGLDGDEYAWESFSLPTDTAITEVRWRGCYTNYLSGAGRAPVTGFTVSIYRSIAAGSQPDVTTGGRLVRYSVTGNAGETAAGVAGGTIMYDYAFTLPSPFQATAGTKYWVQIVASQGLTPTYYWPPDWSFSNATGGNGSYFRKITGGNYQMPPGDLAFSLFASDAPTVSITTSAQPPQGGSVSGAGNYPTNSLVTLNATPNPHFIFSNWSSGGSAVSTSTQYTFTATTNRSLTANFSAAAAVTTASLPTYGGTTTGSGIYAVGSQATVIAVPDRGFVFSGWSDGSQDAAHTFTVTQDIILTALFASAPLSTTFDFDNAPVHTSLPIDLISGSLGAHFAGTDGNFSVQPADTWGINPLGFGGLCLLPNTVFPADLVIDFSEPIVYFSILYSPQELGCDDSATMRATGYSGNTFVATNTATAPTPGTYPSATLSLADPRGFNRVIVHYDARPPTCQDWGPIFFADNVTVTRLCDGPCTRTCDSLDFNNDGNIDPTDVDAYFSILGEGPCLGDAGNGCSDLDFNNDGNIDPTDVDAYFSILGEGPCL